MEKVIITGVTGFIGGAFCRKLLSRGIEVYGIDIDSHKFDELKCYSNFYPIIADFTKYTELPKLISDKDIDVFYHFAWAGGFTSAIKDYKLQMQNAGYAGDAIVAAKGIGCKKFVYAGTYNQFEIIHFLSAKSFEPRNTCIYSTGKTAAGLICRTLAHNLGIDYTAGLIPMPYGENNYSKQLVNVVINNLNNGISPKLVKGDNLYDLVYIDDIAEAFVALGEYGKNRKEYYVGHRKLKTFRTWMSDLRNVIAPEISLKFGEYIDNQQIDYSMIDLEALYEDTGFECKADFCETIKSTAKWVKESNLF